MQACAPPRSRPRRVSRAHEVELYAEYDAAVQPRRRGGFRRTAAALLRTAARNEILRDHYQARFRHILVDEFQDTNRLQYAWLKLLAGADNAIFAVGDDDQSIYAFRGASAATCSTSSSDFAIERVIKLEQNYRSHGHILDAANALIATTRARLGKNLWTAEAKGEPLRVFEAATDLDEAALHRRRSARRCAARACALADIARAVPLQRAVARARARPVQRGHAVPRLRRVALLRAPGSQARARLPAADREP